jgi:parallel beta-helix repeat protein
VGAPWRTLAHAVASSPSGSTIVLRAGTYRESVTWYGKQLTIQNYPGESVWLSGAVAVSGWTADGTSRWYADGWTTKFPRTTSSTFVDPALNPYAGYPDMVFVNGVAQRQVGSRTAVVAGTFFVDYAAARIYLGSDPTGKSVEASKYSRALYLNHANGSVVRGIGIQRYASEPDGMGALFVQANSTTVADVIVRQSAAVGVSVIGQGNVISSSVMKDNGQIGVHGDRANGLSVRSTILQNNNNERFKAGHAQGGLKLTSSTGVLVKDCLVRWNRGRGLWFDISSYDIDVVNNVVVGNGDRGIMVEISAKAVVAGNVVASNGAEGIMISESRDVDVYNNSLWYNARSISVVENSRTSSSSAIPYNVGDVVVRNNLISTARSGTSQLVSTEDTTRSKSAGAMGVSMDYDAYHTASSRVPTWLIGWANYPSGYGVFKDVKTFSAKSGQEKHGSSRVTVGNPFFTDPKHGDFSLSTAAKALPTVALPANVAAALGVAAGTTPSSGASF